MDRFEDMRCFVQVAESQSVTGAASRLNLAPSAVSRRLRDLEARLGAQLLSRTTRRMSLTEAGEVFYRRAAQILRDLDEAEGEITDATHALRGPLRIAAPLSFGLAHLAPVVTDFMAGHPEITVDLDLSDRQVDLVGEGIDIAVRIGRLADSSLVARKLADMRMVVCAAPAFLRRHGPPRAPEDLAAMPGLIYAGSERGDIWRFRAPDGREGSVQVPVRLRANNGEMVREAAIAGLGVAIEPSFIVHAALERGELVPVLADHDWPGVAIHVVYPETRHLSARARAFMQALRAAIARRPDWEAAIDRARVQPS